MLKTSNYFLWKYIPTPLMSRQMITEALSSKCTHVSLSVDLINQLSTGSCVGWFDCIKRITSTTPGWYRRPTQSSGSEIMLWQSSENTELFVPLALCHLSVIPKVDSIFTTWHTITKTFLPKSELASLCFPLSWFTNSCFTCQRGTHLSVLKC